MRFWRRSALSEELKHIEIETKKSSVSVGHGRKASKDSLQYPLPGEMLEGGGKVHCRHTIQRLVPWRGDSHSVESNLDGRFKAKSCKILAG